MAMITLTVVRIIMNSSYALIKTDPSIELGTGGSASPGCPSKLYHKENSNEI